MADNSKFIPKIPETRTEIILNQEQQTPQEQKSTTEKVADSIKNVSEVAKETIIPTAYTSDDKNNGRGSPKIVQEDNKWAKDIVSEQRDQDKQKAIEETPCDIQ